jgi:Uma2 family endonuclease
VEDIFWLIEYSNTSLAKDLEAKCIIYAASEIQKYWLVDLKNCCLRVFRNPVEGNYRTEITLTTGNISPLAFAEAVISVQRLVEG